MSAKSNLLIQEPPLQVLPSLAVDKKLLLSPDDYEFYSGRNFDEDYPARGYVEKPVKERTREYLVRLDMALRYKNIKTQLIERDGEHCQICEAVDKLTIDHKLAVVNGGTNDIENLQLLCTSCNSRKGAR